MRIFTRLKQWYQSIFRSDEVLGQQHFLKQFQYTATVELLMMINKRADYNPIAVAVAIQEIKRRGLSETDRDDYVQAKIIEFDETKMKLPDIYVLEKAVLYFLPFYSRWIIGSLENEWTDDDRELKYFIARRYSINGLAMLIVSMVTTIYT